MNTWQTISKDQSTVTLNKFDGFGSTKIANQNDLDSDEVKIGAVIDVETNGKNRTKDEIIELGIRVFYFNALTGKILVVGEGFNQQNEPKTPIENIITNITGITNSDLKNKRIDWKKASSLIESANLIIAHNAKFDRGFLDRFCNYNRKPVWSCSMSQIDWISYGFPTTNLTLLSAYHGFFTNSHRALADADAVLNILHLNPKYILELYKNAHTIKTMIEVYNTHYNQRELIKDLGYLWNPEGKVWYKTSFQPDVDRHIKALELAFGEELPDISVSDIPLSENFK